MQRLDVLDRVDVIDRPDVLDRPSSLSRQSVGQPTTAGAPEKVSTPPSRIHLTRKLREALAEIERAEREYPQRVGDLMPRVQAIKVAIEAELAVLEECGL